jgi:hypothetical protein
MSYVNSNICNAVVIDGIRKLVKSKVFTSIVVDTTIILTMTLIIVTLLIVAILILMIVTYNDIAYNGNISSTINLTCKFFIYFFTVKSSHLFVKSAICNFGICIAAFINVISDLVLS